MDLTGIYKDNVIGLQVKRLTFNMICDITAYENQYFIKVMIVVGKAVFLLIGNVKKAGNRLSDNRFCCKNPIWVPPVG